MQGKHSNILNPHPKDLSPDFNTPDKSFIPFAYSVSLEFSREKTKGLGRQNRG